MAGISDATKNSSLPEADHDRRAVPHRDDRVRIVRRDQHERKEPAQLRQRAAHRRGQAVVAHLLLDQVRDDLGVRLGDEPVALGGELPLELEVVLDDAVVDDDDAAVQSRCGWAFSSVGRPCVAQRVWPMPYSPSSGCFASTSSRLESLPALRRISSSPLRTTAMPAES